MHTAKSVRQEMRRKCLHGAKEWALMLDITLHTTWHETLMIL